MHIDSGVVGNNSSKKALTSFFHRTPFSVAPFLRGIRSKKKKNVTNSQKSRTWKDKTVKGHVWPFWVCFQQKNDARNNNNDGLLISWCTRWDAAQRKMQCRVRNAKNAKGSREVCSLKWIGIRQEGQAMIMQWPTLYFSWHTCPSAEWCRWV